MSEQSEVKFAKDLKTLGPAPEGHTYAGNSLAYWRKHSDAFECYRYCKWDGYDGRKQQVIVEIVPDVESLMFHQGRSCSWSEDDHGSDCEHCGIVYRRIKE